MKETWKDIPGYEGIYQANIKGEVRKIFQNGSTRLMTPYHKKMSGSQRLVVKLAAGGKAKEVILMQLIALTFIGKCPLGYVAYHRNGMQSDNFINNIAYISRQELGRLTGASSTRKPVVKLNEAGEAVDVYSSARAAAKANYCSYQTVMDRCNGKVKKPLGNIDFAWDDSGRSLKLAQKRLKTG